MKKFNLLFILIVLLACKKATIQKTAKTSILAIENTNKPESIVFIAGYDKGDNTYYKNAKNYFEAQKINVIDHLFSVAEIITFLNQKEQKIYDKIHIVSHSNPWLGMSLTTTKKGERITLEALLKAQEENKIPILNNGANNTTKIIFHSCGLGSNKALLQKVQQLFKTEESPQIIASSFFNVFGSKYAGHYLAKPYYGYYPTAESPGSIRLSKDFKDAYPTIDINWLTALKTRRETSLGEVYSYKFNIPLDWEFTFNDVSEIPKLDDKEAIMDWISESSEIASIIYKLNIPIEKYRWRSSVKGNKLYIKGKTTVLCVLEPILQENDTTEYKSIVFNDRSLYQII